MTETDHGFNTWDALPIDAVHYDALIVGARVAGAATALQLAARGARVLLVDRAPKLSDTLSTHALLRPSVRLLSRWGLLDRLLAKGTPLVRSVSIHYGSRCFSIPVAVDAEVPGLIAPRRTMLDSTMMAAAWEAGARIQLGFGFVECLRNARGRVTGARLRRPDGGLVEVTADIVIGADGRQSSVSKAVGARILREVHDRTIIQYAYVQGIENEGYRWFFAPGLAAGALPTNDGAHCVFASCPRDAAGVLLNAAGLQGVARNLSVFQPDLGAHVARMEPLGHVRRYLGAPGILRERAGDGWALVGDAACFKDPATAHGITDAILDADALARSLATSGATHVYKTCRDAAVAPVFEATQTIARFDWNLGRLEELHADFNRCLKAEDQSLMAVDAPDTRSDHRTAVGMRI